ncbi:uncharacterized protein LOC109541308 [Dendroctonus ponderosae]|nr:uncharacterized protein LOC109541308 [Dendroctonus ponderosae]
MIRNILSLNKEISLKFVKNVSRRNVKSFSSQKLQPVKLAFTIYENYTSKAAPFVIIHGLFGSKQNWTSLCKAYSQKIEPPRKIFAVDLRNHGDSPHSENHTYAHLAEDLRLFLEDNGLEKIFLMGHSMGGRCAMLFALTYPKLLEKLIVVDISPINVSPNFSEMSKIIDVMNRTEMPKNVVLSQARSIVEQQLAEVIPDKGVRAFILTNLMATEDKSYKWRANVPTLLKAFQEVGRFDVENTAQYTGETLFIGGEKSDYLPIRCDFNVVNMTLHKIFSKCGLNFLIVKCIPINVRFKTDLAQTENYKHIVDLAYASYQSTDTIFGKVKLRDVPSPLLILHGFLGSKSNFNTLCKRYHDRVKPKRLVYAVDLRNHGDSAHSKDNSYDDLVMDILKFLKTVGLEKTCVLGHDIGGRIGMLLALKNPELVEKLIISETSPITTSRSFKIFPDVLRILNNLVFPPNLPLPQARAHVVNCLSRIVKSKELMSLVLMNLIQKSDGGYSWRFNNKALLDFFDELSSFPEIHNLEYKGPVLFLGGGKSDYIQKTDFPKILKFFPNAQLKYIEGAGHWLHAEKPNEFLKITIDFLNRPSAG